MNLPADATVEEVDDIFRQAYFENCKGITVYRDGSRSGQTLSAPGSEPGKTQEQEADEPAATTGRKPRPRSRVTHGRTFKFRMGCCGGSLFVTVNRDKHGLCEVFANLGKAGGCPSQSEATCRMVSMALRSGVDPDVLIEQLKGIRCLSASVAKKGNNDVDVLSCPHAIAKAIEETLADDAELPLFPEQTPGRVCPLCEQPMRRESGCFVCDQCSFSSCG